MFLILCKERDTEASVTKKHRYLKMPTLWCQLMTSVAKNSFANSGRGCEKVQMTASKSRDKNIKVFFHCVKRI